LAIAAERSGSPDWRDKLAISLARARRGHSEHATEAATGWMAAWMGHPPGYYARSGALWRFVVNIIVKSWMYAACAAFSSAKAAYEPFAARSAFRHLSIR